MSAPTASEPTPWTRTDALIAGLLAVCAWLLRPADAGLCHFDEGAYACSALAIAQGQFPAAMHPGQPLLSPPLYFTLCGLLMRLVGTHSEQVLLQVSSVAGALCAPMLFGLGRACLGRAAGAVAGLLLALSQLQAGFATMALTDPLFLLCFLLALWLLWRAEQARSLILAACAGLAVGLAWNTKYHGWLALVVAAPAVLWHARVDGVRALAAAALRLAVAAGVAGAAFLPWFWFVQSQPGGYAAVVQQQRQFLREWRAALAHGADQLGYVAFLDAWWWGPLLSCAALALGWRRPLVLLALLPLAAAALLHSATLALAGAALLALPLVLRQQGGGLLVVGWCAVFTVLTPLYHPYPRLLLPWHAAVCLLAGAALAWWGQARPRAGWILMGWLAAATLGALLLPGGLGALHATFARTSLRTVADALAPALTPADVPVAVLGEPALVFHLRQAGRQAFHLNSPRDLPVGRDLFLITGLYAERAPGVAQWLAAHQSELQPAATHEWAAPDLRRIDDSKPGALLWPDSAPPRYRFVAQRVRLTK